MKQFAFLVVLTLCFMTISPNAEAKRFRNSYISFELPSGWKCRPLSVSWICNHYDATIKKEAQIVIAAKEAGPSDTLSAYTQYLKQARSIEGFKKGTTTRTREIHTKTKLIGNKNWVDSLHLSGETEAYYTRYFATAHKDLAILATFTIHRNAYPYHSASILKAIESMSIVFNKPIIGGGSASKNPSKGTGVIGNPIGIGGAPNTLDMDEEIQTKSSGSKNKLKFLGLFFILAAVGFYYYIKRKSR